MAIRYTSRISLSGIADSLKGLRREVYSAIANWNVERHGLGPSIEDLSALLGRKESSIAGRVHELKKANAIEEAPIKINTSGKPAMTYAALEYKEPEFKRVEASGQTCLL